MAFYKVKLTALIPSEAELLLEADSEKEALAKAVVWHDHRRAMYWPRDVATRRGRTLHNQGAQSVVAGPAVEIDIDQADNELLKELIDYRDQVISNTEDDEFWKQHD